MTVAAVPAARGRSNGWWGMALFVAAESTLIGAIVGSYFYLRVNTPVWPPHGIPMPSVLAPVVLTAVLAAALIPFRAAVHLARRGARGQAFALLVLATCAQAAYFGIQIHLFDDSLGRFGPQANAYASIYYVLLGADHAHVAIGLLFDAWLLARIAFRLTPYRLRALQAVALYWTAVVVLTIVVVLTQLSPRM
ncbi:MAG TPA: cytochrome c oxidase subunit 3 [Gaiellaceae bacterium]|nr:cytochrome c oxidase subunit 3 [Gaiellaceae bacterium]